MLEAFLWFSENSHVILEALGATVALATLITKLTRAPKAEAFLAKVAGLLRRFSLLGYRNEVRAVYEAEPPLIQKRVGNKALPPPKAEKL